MKKTAKLSHAQIRCLDTMKYGTRPLPLSATAETRRMNTLIKMGLVARNDGIYCPEYHLTLDGRETLRALDGTQPAITVHLNAAPDLSPKTAAALDGLIKIAVQAIENDEVIEDADDDPSFESLTDMSKWTETRAILVRDPETGEITVHPDTPPTPRPLTSDEEGLLELAESVADGLESGDIILVDDDGVPVTFVDTDAAQRDHDEAMGAVMFLDFQHAAFMDRVCSFDGLVIWHHDEIGMGMALKLEKGGLVTIDRSMLGGVVVSAVRGDGEGE